MKKLTFILLFIPFFTFAQQVKNNSTLSIETIMQGYDWIGHPPDDVFWGEHSEIIYFDWNPENAFADSLYRYIISDNKIDKVSPEERLNMVAKSGDYTRNFSKKVYGKHGDIFIYNIEKRTQFQITHTAVCEENPKFSYDEQKVFFEISHDLYSWDRETGQIKQLTNFKRGTKSEEKEDMPKNEQQKWLYYDQLKMFEILRERKEKKEKEKKIQSLNQPQSPREIYTGTFSVISCDISPDENYVIFSLYKSKNNNKIAEVPNYVTESGYTENIKTRTKVGDEGFEFKMGIYDISRDSAYYVNTDTIPGVSDVPDYYKHYPEKELEKPGNRAGIIYGPYWNKNGDKNIIEVRSTDGKDRWIMQLNLKDGVPALIDRQHDTAWVAGPGIGYYSISKGDMGWIGDNRHVWFISEETGYAHLYLFDMQKKKKKALTKGKFEIFDVRLSRDKQNWYFLANKEHPGVRHLYRLPVDGGKMIKITSNTGYNDCSISPDETKIAVRYSSANQPWELFLMQNQPQAALQQVTHSRSEEFKNYPWRKPEIITFKARDGAKVYARLFEPKTEKKNNAAVLFVHGAGYLQNAHKWWSSYYREYMFHNILADNGYTVLDIDYRGSAGYGRDWRTGIYRHMAGKDLTDQVDGAKYLIDNYGINPDKIGIYGGSYGGFITIMAMFLHNDIFEAGAAIRSVTDWAHYNHYYTSNILNDPVTDSLAYVRSSPIYHADKFTNGHLLILHGMLDLNVHFQDVVRLSQRLIELGKENWDFAVYPLEDHGFVEPSSWTDEYKRIYKYFEIYLQGKKPD